MIPMRTSRTRPVLRAFDVITPAGLVHRFPRPTLFQCAAAWFSRFVEPIALAAIVITLVCTAGLLAESLEPIAANHCLDRLSDPDVPA